MARRTKLVAYVKTGPTEGLARTFTADVERHWASFAAYDVQQTAVS